MVALVQASKRIPPRRQIDRRLFSREAVHLEAEARRLDHSVAAYRQPRISLAVRDLSAGGMSALSLVPLSKGEHVGVCFPGEQAGGVWDAFGRVVRCEPSALGYRVAVEFDPLPAA
jgi:hypothetical protein